MILAPRTFLGIADQILPGDSGGCYLIPNRSRTLGLTIGELCRLNDISNVSAERAIARLVELGLIEVAKEPADER